METFISGDASGFTPEEYEDIVMCLRTLFAIREGEQPLDRSLGIDYEKIVSYPIPIAKNMITLEIMDKVERYEPRVTIDKVEFDADLEGNLTPKVYFVKRRG